MATRADDGATSGTGKSVSSAMRLLAQPLPTIKHATAKSHWAGWCKAIMALLIGTPLILQRCHRYDRRVRALRPQTDKFAH